MMGIEESACEKYKHDTAEHAMTVFHDDGVYRHLRFQKPDTWTYGYDLVTWPGYLAITGDAGEYMFSRIRDMFDFFPHDGERINPHYWSEKLCSGRESARSYSETVLADCVTQWFENLGRESDSSLVSAVRRDVLGRYNEYEAREALAAFRHDDGTTIDSWEWDLREYDGRFLWCCWAILYGIKRYRERA